MVDRDRIQHAIEWIVNFRRRTSARRRKFKTARIRNSTIKSIQGLVDKSGTDFKHSRVVHNLSLYVLLIDQDLAELSTDMVCAIGDKRRNFIARNLAVLLYEVSQDLPELTGRAYRESLTTLKVSDEWISELNEVSKDLNKFKNAHRIVLGEIRNIVAAHRDKDAIAQINLMKQLEPLDILRLAADFQRAIDKLATLQIKVTSFVGNRAIILQDFLISHRNESTN